jgi:hypothetical protein
MALFDKLKLELDRAGQTAQRALDEGKLRLELFRARQSVDRFAQRFGYATFNAKKAGGELPAEELASHMSNLNAAEADITRLEALLHEAAGDRKGPHANTPAPTPSPTAGAGAPPPSDAGSAPQS